MSKFFQDQRYGLVIVTCVVAGLLAWTFGAPAPWLLVGIVLSTVGGGREAGLFSAAISTPIFYFLSRPQFHVSTQAHFYVQFAAFVLASALVVWLKGSRSPRDKEISGVVERQEIPIGLAPLMLEAVPCFTWSTTDASRLDYISRSVLDYTGKTSEALRDWSSILHPDDIELQQKIDERRLRTGQTDQLQDYELRLLGADGTYRWFELRVQSLRDAQGKIFRWYGLLVDIEARKRSEQALKASEQSANQLLEVLPGSVWTSKLDGEVEFLSQSFLDYTGKSLEEVKSDPYSIVHPDDVEARIRVLQQMAQSRQPTERVLRLRRFDGAYRWFQTRTRPLRDDTGEVIRWYNITWDIDDFMGSEAALRESEQHLRLIVETLPALVWLADTQGQIYHVNQRTLIYTGKTMVDLNNVGWIQMLHDVIHPEDVEATITKWLHCVDTGKSYDDVYRLRRADGTYRWAEVRAEPLCDKEGRVLRWYGLHVDIDDRKRAEEARQESEHHLRLLIDTMPALVWAATPEGGPAYINRRMAEFTGISMRDLQGTEALGLGDSGPAPQISQWGLMIHPDDFETSLPEWTRSLQAGQTYDTTIRLRRADGVYRWFQVRGEPLRNEEGRIIHWYGVNIDIDDSRQMEEMLENAQTRLSRATQIATVAELSASIAHEINQPLAAVVASGHACLAWLSASPPNTDRARTAAERIIRDGNSAAEVVQRIRSLFKQAAPTKTPLDVNDVITEVIRLVRNEVRKKSINVEMDLQEHLPKTFADRVQIQQVLINLVLNGMEAMESSELHPKSLLIRSRSSGAESILVEVQDRGKGFADPEKIFESFFTTKESGMGMGLTICRSIIETHSGRLWASSGGDKGTVFSFSLPAVQADKQYEQDSVLSGRNPPHASTESLHN